MSVISSSILAGASGAAGGGDKVYVDDVFSTDLYTSDGNTKTVNNGIKLGAPSESLNGKTITDTTGGGADYSKLNNNITSSANSDYYYGSIDCYIDYGSAVVSTSYSLFPQGDNSQSPKVVYNTPDSVTAYGSNNASSWTTLGTTTFTASDWAEGQATKAVFENLTAYRYYRLTVAGTKSLQEWHLGIGQSGEGGLVWFKNRTSTWNHILVDSERSGANAAGNSTLYPLVSNNYNAQLTNVAPTSFNNNGYTTAYNIGSSQEFVSWTFRKAPGFFDIVTYTGNDTPRTIAHNLGTVPGMIMVKRTSSGSEWAVYHRSLGNTHFMYLNNTTASGTYSGGWNNTTPTSTHFTVGSGSMVNSGSDTYVAYVFAHDAAQFGTNGDESIIKCGVMDQGTGSYNIGFEPQFMLVKPAGATGSWALFDNMRGFGLEGVSGAQNLFADTSAAESAVYGVYLTSTGFKNGSYSTADNAIYIAIRRPNKPPEAATEVFAMDTGAGSGSNPAFDSGFPVDLAFRDNEIGTRLTGSKYLWSITNNGESSSSLYVWDSNVGWAKDYGSNQLAYMFKRAPGFMDVVAYSGTGTVATHSHNLTVTPEMMIVKCRNSENWRVYVAPVGATKALRLNTDNETTTSSNFWNDTAPTSSVFTVANYAGTNQSGKTYVNYLFATLPGISKVGSYSGNTGYAVNVPCGFTGGARFILIKRTDSTGDWYYWDTTSGITSGNDPYRRFNASGQVTNTDYIDPLSTGFTVTASAPAALNATGGTYLFLAIA